MLKGSHTIASTLVASLLLSGCSVPIVETNPAPTITAAAFSAQQNESEALHLHTPWWQQLKDQKLKNLIETAFAQSLTLAQAKTRITQAQSYITQSSATRLPSLDLGARSSQTQNDNEATDTLHQFGAIINWEVDILGRLKNSLTAREYELQKTLFEYEFAKLLLSANIANAYYQAIEQRKQLLLLQQQLQTDQELYDLTQRRFTAGIASRVDVLQQNGQLTETKSLIPNTESTLRTLENQLDILLGKAPSGGGIIQDGDHFPKDKIVPEAGVPSDLLLNRPDLKAKQAILIAADADHARAILDRFPVVTIFADIGVVAGNGPSGLAANVISSLLQPILDWGHRRAEVSRREAIYQERLLDYTQSYIAAIAEVENLLFQIQKQKEFIIILKERIGILEETVEETKKRYTGGLTDYLPVLDAVQQLRIQQRELVRQKRILATTQTQLFVALGEKQVTQ